MSTSQLSPENLAEAVGEVVEPGDKDQVISTIIGKTLYLELFN